VTGQHLIFLYINPHQFHGWEPDTKFGVIEAWVRYINTNTSFPSSQVEWSPFIKLGTRACKSRTLRYRLRVPRIRINHSKCQKLRLKPRLIQKRNETATDHIGAQCWPYVLVRFDVHMNPNKESCKAGLNSSKTSNLIQYWLWFEHWTQVHFGWLQKSHTSMWWTHEFKDYQRVLKSDPIETPIPSKGQAWMKCPFVMSMTRCPLD
jgi:hypothetical protein